MSSVSRLDRVVAVWCSQYVVGFRVCELRDTDMSCCHYSSEYCWI